MLHYFVIALSNNIIIIIIIINISNTLHPTLNNCVRIYA